MHARRQFLIFGPLVLLSMVSNLLMLTGPLFMLQVYDRVLSSRSLPTLFVLVLLITGLFAFYGFVEAIRSRMSLRLANLVDHAIGEKLFATGVRLRLVSGQASALDPVREGDSIRAFLGGPGPMALLDLPWVPLYLAIIFMVHPLLGWLATGGGALIICLMLINEFALRKPAKDSSSALSVRQRRTDDVRNNAEAVVAMGMLATMERRWSEQSRKMLALQRISSDRSTSISSLTKAVRFLLQSLVLALGAYLVIQGEMTGGLMIAASIITSRALAPVEQTIAQWKSFVQARQAYGRIKKYLAVEPSLRMTQLPLPRAGLSVRGLGAAPQGAARPVVSGIQFELAAGDGLGVLGPSGSGKSSVAKALLGVWPATAGEVRLDGALLAHYDDGQVGEICGYLPQHVELLDGSVAENIARFRPEASSEAVIEAAQLASIHGLINALPDGYDTQVGLQGDRLSAGQRQRIGLARALFGDPFLVILDEPNSNLDAEGEAALTAAIKAIRARGGIVIVIAHRPSAVVAVDKLLVLKGGRQIAFGPKDEVLAQITGENVHPLKVPGQ